MSKPKEYILVCAWCKKLIKDGDEEGLISHGICSDCFEKEIKKMKEERLKRLSE